MGTTPVSPWCPYCPRLFSVPFIKFAEEPKCQVHLRPHSLASFIDAL